MRFVLRARRKLFFALHTRERSENYITIKRKKVSYIFFQRYLGDLLSPAEIILVSLLQIDAELFRTYRTDDCAASCYIVTTRGQQQAFK